MCTLYVKQTGTLFIFLLKYFKQFICLSRKGEYILDIRQFHYAQLVDTVLDNIVTDFNSIHTKGYL